MKGGAKLEFPDIKKIENKVKRDMKTLKVYRKEYDAVIRVYASLLFDYELKFIVYSESNFALKIEQEVGDGEEIKIITVSNPVVKHLENLRKDIKIYSDVLGLNVKAEKNSIVEPSLNKFEILMSKRKKA